MSPVREVQHAQARRDAGLAGVRRITLWAGAGAIALTAAVSWLAATTFPGRTTTANAATAPAPVTTPAGSGDGGGSVPPDGGSTVPSGVPVQPAGGNGPVSVSGGS